MHIVSVYFGNNFHCIVKNIYQKDLRNVKERCKGFLCTLAEEIWQPENSTLKMIANLYPRVATSQMKPDLEVF